MSPGSEYGWLLVARQRHRDLVCEREEARLARTAREDGAASRVSGPWRLLRLSRGRSGPARRSTWRHASRLRPKAG